MGLGLAVVHLAAQHLALAGAAGAVAAAVGHGQALAQGGFQNGLVGFGREMVLAGFDGDGKAHGSPFSTSKGTEPAKMPRCKDY